MRSKDDQGVLLKKPLFILVRFSKKENTLRFTLLLVFLATDEDINSNLSILELFKSTNLKDKCTFYNKEENTCTESSCHT